MTVMEHDATASATRSAAVSSPSVGCENALSRESVGGNEDRAARAAPLLGKIPSASVGRNEAVKRERSRNDEPDGSAAVSALPRGRCVAIASPSRPQIHRL